MNVAWGRLILIALASFMASAAPEFDSAWKQLHIAINAVVIAGIPARSPSMPEINKALVTVP